MITLKPITIPKNKIVSAQAFVNKTYKTLTTASNEIKAEYKKTVRGWKRKPVFVSRITYASGYTLSVYPSGNNARQYIWVDLGTKPHSIVPKHSTWLYFYRGFKPRTRTGWIGSGTQKYFPPKVQAEGVVQSIKARDFSETIGRRYQTRFTSLMQDAMRITAKSFEE